MGMRGRDWKEKKVALLDIRLFFSRLLLRRDEFLFIHDPG